MTTESDLGQCLFTLDDAFFLVAYRGKKFLDCVWMREAAAHGAKRSHAKEVLFDAFSLLPMVGETKP